MRRLEGCASCGDNDGALLQCGDDKMRCVECCMDAGWCLSCGEHLGPRTAEQNRTLGLCNQCGPEDGTDDS